MCVTKGFRSKTQQIKKVKFKFFSVWQYTGMYASPLQHWHSGMVRGNYWDQWFLNGFGFRQPLASAVYDGCPPLVQWWNGYLPSSKSSTYGKWVRQENENRKKLIHPWIHDLRKGGYKHDWTQMTVSLSCFQNLTDVRGVEERDGKWMKEYERIGKYRIRATLRCFCQELIGSCTPSTSQEPASMKIDMNWTVFSYASSSTPHPRQ